MNFFPDLEKRFAAIQTSLKEMGNRELLDKPVVNWVNSSDRHLPQVFIFKSIQDVIDLKFDQLINTPGVGHRRIEKLFDVLERIDRRATGKCETEVSGPTDDSVIADVILRVPLSVENVTDSDWTACRQIIRAHGLNGECLGRFSSSLVELPQGLWELPFSDFTERSLHEVNSLVGYGVTRINLVLDLISRVVHVLSKCPVDGPISIQIAPRAIREAATWAEKLLREKTEPSVSSIQECFLKPLFAQLKTDLGLETEAIIRRRIGLDGPAETLEQIGQDIGITRERVRQLERKAVNVTRIRWPDGRYILEKVYDLLQQIPSCVEQSELMRNVLETCFALKVSQGLSKGEVLAAWCRAGRDKLTPMTEAQVRSWAANSFPNHSIDAVLYWLKEEGMFHPEIGNEPLFLSKEPLDELILKLLSQKKSISLNDISIFDQEDERNIRNRIDRDLRLIEDDSKQVHLAEEYSFFRKNDQWFVELEPVHGIKQLRTGITIAELVNLIVGGLGQSGVCDATVWGVHRFASIMLRRVYGAALQHAITPFIFAGVLVRHSDGLINHMRRRRLRWDLADGSVPVRGKFGWVDHVMESAGVPMTFDEFDGRLRAHFQDYERYVLKQLHLKEDEEGQSVLASQYVPGVHQIIPPIIIPNGWELEISRVNVSEGIKKVAKRIALMSVTSPIPRRYIRRIPWMAQLCEQISSGVMNWSDLDQNINDDVASGLEPFQSPAISNDDIEFID